jgi:hypothetical protein
MIAAPRLSPHQGDEAAVALAAALALGLPAFPCRRDKAPACPHGYCDATALPLALRELWRRHPGPLIGMPTGAATGVDVLDVDAPRHGEAAAWWSENRSYVPKTRVHRTRSGGAHVIFLHAAGLRCSASRIAAGVDIRANGGYIIWWPAAGLPVLCDAPPAPWPEWLLKALPAPPRTGPNLARTLAFSDPPHYRAGSRYANAALRNAAERVAWAPSGSRNRTLNTEAYVLGRLVAEGLLDGQEVADTLATAALAAGLEPPEVERTLRSAFGARGLR